MNQQFEWKPEPAAAAWVQQQLEASLKSNSWLREFGERLRAETGTRLMDWIDHIIVGQADGLAGAGFARGEDDSEIEWHEHPGGIFPKVVVTKHHESDVASIALRIESQEDFLDCHRESILTRSITGKIGEPFRIGRVNPAGSTSEVHLVERHGHRGFSLTHSGEYVFELAHSILTRFRTRNRSYSDPTASFSAAKEIAEMGIDALGRSYICDLFFRAEREFWQSRNLAARVQYDRQRKLGMGWANHDHHTYRCSRECFAPLIEFLEFLGMECRERFYAGSDAGWGAQVLEHPECGIVVFADVDMSAEELAGDFAHQGLPPTSDLGTVGLWCKLHGDSFTSAGMHHLECQFDFVGAQEQLAEAGIATMAPFTDFSHLKQAFTKGERWEVPADRLAKLESEGVISAEDRKRFENEGAIGSHLEILERNDGFKGFNQTGISEIILKTNPRHAT